MISINRAVTNVANSTKPSSNIVPMEGVNDLNIGVIVKACRERGVFFEEKIAAYLALTAQDAIDAGYNPMKLMKEQIECIQRQVNKLVPDRKAVDAEGSSDEKHVIQFVTDYGD